MNISDFTALIQLGATLNIAFVAVEYAKAYTVTLAEKVFKFQDFIVRSFDNCQLVDRDTLNHLEPSTIDGQSTVSQIEKVKREREKLSEEIESTKQSLNGQIHVLCETKSLSTLSLWLFLYSVLALFQAGVEEKYAATHIFWTFFTLCTLIYVSLGWILGEKEKQIKCLDFVQLRHCIIYFCLLWAICFIVALAVQKNESSNLHIAISSYWNLILIVSAILPFANFIAFIVKIRVKAKIIRINIEERAKKINVKCIQLGNAAHALISVSQVSAELKIKKEEQ